MKPGTTSPLEALSRVQPSALAYLAHLFAGVSGIPVIVEGGLEGVLGSVMVDGSGAATRARLDLGVYRILGGQPGADGEVFIRDAPLHTEFAAANESWLDLVRSHYGARLEPLRMKIFDLPDQYAIEEPRPPEGFELHPLAAQHLSQLLDPELGPNGLQSFVDPEALLDRGFGVVALRGDEVAAVASTYSASARGAEVAIATRPTFRRLGLAYVASLAFMKHSLSLGLSPRWSASNPFSQRLAGKLGFVEAGECELLRVEGKDPSLTLDSFRTGEARPRPSGTPGEEEND